MGEEIWTIVLIACSALCIFIASYFALKGDTAGTVFMCSMAWWFRVSVKEREEADGNG